MSRGPHGCSTLVRRATAAHAEGVRTARLLVAAVALVGCGASTGPVDAPASVLAPTSVTATTAPAATTTASTSAATATTASVASTTVAPGTTGSTLPAPRATAAPGPPFENASCIGDIVGTFSYVDGSTAAVRTGPTDFCVADGSAAMNVPYLPPSDAPTPYIGVSSDSWLGSFVVVALPGGFPATFTVARADGTSVPAVLGADGRSVLVRMSDTTVPGPGGELTFLAPDGGTIAVTGRP